MIGEGLEWFNEMLNTSPTSKTSSCLIVGAGGFIGFNLCLELVKKYGTVFACDTFFSESITLRLREKNIEIIEGGVEGFVLSFERYKNIRDIFYFAGKSTPSLLENEMSKGYFFDQENLVMMLESCSEMPCLHSFIYGSSGGTVYGENDNLCNESDILKPISAYGLSKQIQESYINFYARRFHFLAKIARISNPYGRALTHGTKHLQGVVDTTINKIKYNEIIEVWGDGNVVRDYIFILDLVQGITAISKKIIPAGVYNIGSGIGHSINDIIKLYKGIELQFKVKYKDSRKIDVRSNILNINKIKNSTGWVPTYDLETGVKELINQELINQD